MAWLHLQHETSIHSSASVFLIVQLILKKNQLLISLPNETHLWAIQPELKHFSSSWRSRCWGKGNRHHLLRSGCRTVLDVVWNCWNKRHLGISDSDVSESSSAVRTLALPLGLEHIQRQFLSPLRYQFRGPLRQNQTLSDNMSSMPRAWACIHYQCLMFKGLVHINILLFQTHMISFIPWKNRPQK